MKVKVLVVPTLIVLSGFVIFNYIKPDFNLYKQKRTERNTARDHALEAESIANNVRILTGELETQKEKVDFVKRYLPNEKDEARTYDSLNFLTGQAGLVTSKIQIQKAEDEGAEAGENSSTFTQSIDPVAAAMPAAVRAPGAGGMMGGVTSYKPPALKKYSFSLEALGGYGNIKDLLVKLQGFDRLQHVQGFKISSSETNNTSGESAEGGTETTSVGTLTLSYDSILPYQLTPGVLSGENIVSIPGLKQGSFNFSTIESLQAAVTDKVPDTVLGTEGRANPFE